MRIVPWGLFRPYKTNTDTLASILIPLVILFAAAVSSGTPVFQVKGIWVATLYVFASFLILCCLRRWMLGLSSSYIPPSAIGVLDARATVVPMLCWVGGSLLFAHLMWGWK
jgi:hypothetical protein